MTKTDLIDESTTAMSKAYSKFKRKKHDYLPLADDGFVAGWNEALIWQMKKDKAECQ